MTSHIARNPLWVAHLDEVIVGWVEVEGNRIVGLYVDPSYCARGFGSRLLETAGHAVLESGARTVVLEASWNAEDFYLHRGYEPLDLVDESFDTIPGIRRFYDKVHRDALEFLRSLPNDAGSRIYQTNLGPLSIDAMALYAIDEEIHHRAQLGIYLRCLGIRPPAFVQNYQELIQGGDEGSEGSV